MNLSVEPPETVAAFPAWLDRYPSAGSVAHISSNRPYQFAEGEYDGYYGIDPADEASGLGVVNLLQRSGGDFGGPLLELGCGSGKMTVGLCKTDAFPHYLITDGSQAFLDLTRSKLERHGVPLGRVRFATLIDADVQLLPAGSLSAVVMRSTLHHFLDVPRFINDTAATLRPGGVLSFQEPCASGYLLMGLLARLLLGEIGQSLTDAQRQKAKLMADTMAAYHRTDLDKSTWEDKHLFRPEQIYDWAHAAGLVTRFFPNHEFEDFAIDPVIADRIQFARFTTDYLRYCMGFGQSDSDAMMARLAPYVEYLVEASRGTREPQLMGIFVLQRPRGAVA